MNFNFIMFMVCSLMSKIFTMAIPAKFLNKRGLYYDHLLCFWCMISAVVTGKNGIDLLRKLKHESLESITLSNSKMFSIPMTKSTLSWILDTKVKISNLCPCTSIIIGITKSTLNILSISHLNSLCI